MGARVELEGAHVSGRGVHETVLRRRQAQFTILHFCCRCRRRRGRVMMVAREAAHPDGRELRPRVQQHGQRARPPRRAPCLLGFHTRSAPSESRSRPAPRAGSGGGGFSPESSASAPAASAAWICFGRPGVERRRGEEEEEEAREEEEVEEEKSPKPGGEPKCIKGAAAGAGGQGRAGEGGGREEGTAGRCGERAERGVEGGRE